MVARGCRAAGREVALLRASVTVAMLNQSPEDAVDLAVSGRAHATTYYYCTVLYCSSSIYCVGRIVHWPFFSLSFFSCARMYCTPLLMPSSSLTMGE